MSMYADPGPDEIDGVFNDEVRSRVKAELEPGERLLWAGGASCRSVSHSGGFLAWSCVAAVGSVVGCVSWAQIAVHPLREIGGLLFLGLAMGVLAFFTVLGLFAKRTQRRAERAKLSKTLYALTDRRAVIWSPRMYTEAVKVVTIPRGSVTGVHRIEYPDGSGDVIFTAGDHGFQHGYEYGVETGFLSVADVRRVEEQVRRTLVMPPAGKSD